MQRIYQSFERQTMMQTLGAQLGEVRAGYVEIIAPILEFCAMLIVSIVSVIVPI